MRVFRLSQGYNLRSPFFHDVAPFHWVTDARRFGRAWLSHRQGSKCSMKNGHLDPLKSDHHAVSKRRSPIAQ
jgi:hypothetical protein